MSADVAHGIGMPGLDDFQSTGITDLTGVKRRFTSVSAYESSVNLGSGKWQTAREEMQLSLLATSHFLH